VDPVPLSLVSAGRSLTEPRLSPDGDQVAFVQRWNGAASIQLVAATGVGPERQLTFGAEPAPGRGFGGGCFTWVGSDGAGPSIVYSATDGELWVQRGLDLRRLTAHEGSARAPAVAGGTTRSVVYVLDEAEVWIADLDSDESRRLDDGRHAFCFDPAVSPDGLTVSWTGWSPPDMAWDGAVRVDLVLATGIQPASSGVRHQMTQAADAHTSIRFDSLSSLSSLSAGSSAARADASPVWSSSSMSSMSSPRSWASVLLA